MRGIAAEQHPPEAEFPAAGIPAVRGDHHTTTPGLRGAEDARDDRRRAAQFLAPAGFKKIASQHGVVARDEPQLHERRQRVGRERVRHFREPHRIDLAPIEDRRVRFCR